MMYSRNPNVWAVSFSSVAATGTEKDLFEITPSTVSNVALREVCFGRVDASFSSSEQELLNVSIWRGSSAAGGGSTGTAYNMDGRSSATATFTSVLNATEPGSSGSTVDLIKVMPWNTKEPFVWRPPADERPICKLQERLQIRLSGPSVAMTVGGTVVVEEIGHAPGSTVR